MTPYEKRFTTKTYEVTYYINGVWEYSKLFATSKASVKRLIQSTGGIKIHITKSH